MKTQFEKRRHEIGQRDVLEWIRVRNVSPQGLVFVPPLIGGTISQQVNAFRWLIRRGYDLFSFNYSGHGDSSDRFSLGATLRDTRHMLGRAAGLSQKENLPLLGIASCYSAMPVMYATYRLGEPIRKLVLINGIPTLGPQAVMRSFSLYYRKILFTRKGPLGVGAVLRDYADSLFPEVIKGKSRFGVLERSRAKFFRTIAEFFTLQPLKGVKLRQTPALCLQSREDTILDIYDGHLNEDYRRTMRRVCPRASFQTLEGDHFLSLPSAKGEAARSISVFFGDQP
jgi:pimeloyl-ACP methyl ester carboxylesterase